MDFESIKQLKSKVKYDDASKRLDEITSKIVKVNNKLEKSKFESSNDWTNIYKFCEDYEDIEDLNMKLKKEEDNLNSMKQYDDNIMGHAHDHSEERKIFEKPEEEKIKLVEHHYNTGNLLYMEGNWSSAIQDYQLAIAYYEYCFPKDSTIQIKIDNIKLDSICQLASCYSNMGYHKMAVDAFNNSLTTNKACAIGYFRRGISYRYLDEFEKSRSDLIEAMKLFEESTDTHADYYKLNIMKQLQLLDRQEKNALISEKQLAINMLNGNNSEKKKSTNIKSNSFQVFSNISTLHTKNEILPTVMDFDYPLDI
jgi:tetratricopeptide (TPR) repeat protein